MLLPPLLSPQSRSGLEWLTLLVSLVVLGSYIGWSLANERLDVEDRERDRLATQARVIDVHIVTQIHAIRRVLIGIREDLPASHPQLYALAQPNQRLENLIDALIGVQTLGIINTDGRWIASNNLSYINRTFSERDYFTLTQQNQDPNALHVSPPFFAESGKWEIMLSMNTLSEQGGLVVATLEPDRFHATLDSVNYAKDMWSAIAHGDGLQFMMVPERPGQAGMNLAQPGSFFMRHRESGKLVNVMTGKVYATGEDRMMVLHTIQPPTLHMDKPLVIAVGRDLNKVFSRWRNDAIFRATLFLLLALTASIALYRLQRFQRAFERNAADAATDIRKKNAELEALNKQLRSLALADGLTGVANRRRFDEVIENEWHRCRRDHVPLALLMIDIDHFKDFNDHYGHQAGDDCLKQIARTLNEGFSRAIDLVARYGGEEFVCLMPETDSDGASAIAETLCTSIEKIGIVHEHSATARYVTVSIGVAVQIPNDKGNPDGLIAEADKALYRAKRLGRNRVCCVKNG